MVNRLPGPLFSWEKWKPKNILRPIVLIAIIIAVGLLLWKFVWHKSQPKSYTHASPTQVESIDNSVSNKWLNSKDYESYQSERLTLATQYLTNNDPANAERIMLEVINNVPSDKIDSSVYTKLYLIEKAKGNVALQKKYLSLAISKFKAEGKNDLAASAQKVLDGIQ